MRLLSHNPNLACLTLAIALSAPSSLFAQMPEAPRGDITVTGGVEQLPDLATMAAGPEIKGIIAAHNANKIKVVGADGVASIIAISNATRIRSGGGLFGGGANNLRADALLNGLPVTVKTLQWNGGLVAGQITFKSNDFKTANMIRNGTDQRFAEQAAATEALRGRMADIDQYNIKSTTNVNFDTGKSALSSEAKNELCTVAGEAQATNNALLLVVGYTDSVGSEEYNQVLSERRASSVINYLQQACHWKPYRMLTPTGMAEADPVASNDTFEGKAQNRRVSVNVLVSKAVDGM